MVATGCCLPSVFWIWVVRKTRRKPLPRPFDLPRVALYLVLVGYVLLIAGLIVSVILLIKTGFDRTEARDKKEKDDKKD